MALGKVIAAVSPYLKFQVFSQEYKLFKCKKNPLSKTSKLEDIFEENVITSFLIFIY